MATTETFVPGRLYEMPLADLQPDPNQPRKYLDPAALDELTESVKQQSVVAPIRKNPSVPKRVLIEIAAKKQERSMFKAYGAYKASINPVKKTKPGETVTQAQRVMNAMGAMGRKIEAIEPRNLYLEEKAAVAAALNGLKGVIEIALAAITGPGPEETPAEDASEGDTPQDETSGDASSETTPLPEKKPKILA